MWLWLYFRDDANVLESLWQCLATLVMLVWVEMGDTAPFLCPGLGWGLSRVAERISLVRSHVERQEMGWAPYLHCDLQFGGPEYLLFCDSSLGHPKYFRSEKGIPPADWQTEMLRERNGSLWNTGESFHCPHREPVAPDPQRSTWSFLQSTQGWTRGKKPPALPANLPRVGDMLFSALDEGCLALSQRQPKGYPVSDARTIAPCTPVQAQWCTLLWYVTAVKPFHLPRQQ